MTLKLFLLIKVMLCMDIMLYMQFLLVQYKFLWGRNSAETYIRAMELHG